MDDLYTPFGSDGLSLAERARLGRLPDELSLYEISLLLAPDNPSEQRTWQNVLLKLAQEGKLAVAHGDPKGWSYWEGTVHAANPYPRCEAHIGWSKALSAATTSNSPLSRQATFRKEGYPSNYQQATQVAGQACLVHQDALKACVTTERLAIPKTHLLTAAWGLSSTSVNDDLTPTDVRLPKKGIKQRNPSERYTETRDIMDHALTALEEELGYTPKPKRIWMHLLNGGDTSDLVARVSKSEQRVYLKSDEWIDWERLQELYRRVFIRPKSKNRR